MRLTRRLVRDLSAAVLAGTTIAAAPAEQSPAASVPGEGAATFAIMLRGVRIGFETVSLSRTPSGWLITSGGRLQPPFDMMTTRFELNYGPEWKPRHLVIEGVLQGQLVSMATVFEGETATTTLIKGEARASSTIKVSPETVVLPANFFGAYEALAAQIGGMGTGTVFRAYLAPEFEVPASVDGVTTRRIALPGDAIDVRDFRLTLTTPVGPTPVEVWVDTSHRLVRVVLPRAGLVAIREDLATVLAREEHVRNPGDESLFIPSTGFTLGATLTRSAGSGAPVERRPAVVLVSAPGPQDRDYTLFGGSGTVSVFGQLAGALAEHGFLVVRYDPRGVGQSGGRTEHATLDDYAQDVRHVINWLRRRRDVDGNRLAVVGYAEGAAVALLAARREDRIRAVALLGAPSVDGRTLTMAQQRELLDRLGVSAAERAEKIALQTRVLDATMSGEGWENIPVEFRRQAESATFRSWLQFDPAPVISRLEQPLLIVHGALDDQIAPEHADRLAALGASRDDIPPGHTRKVLIPDVTHRFVTADSGNGLAQRITAEVPDTLAVWLGEMLRRR
jgi:pimeloyl-ACP methyl ester carboxylesterase